MARHPSKDNLIIADLHGTAWRYASQRGSIDEALTELRDLSRGRLDLLAQAAGLDAGLWYAKPSNDARQLFIAGLLVSVSGRIDQGELTRWTRIGYGRAFEPVHGTHSYPDPSHVAEWRAKP